MTGRSATRRMSSRLSSTTAFASTSLARSFSGWTASIASYIASSVPKVPTSFAAVFSPTPGTPGMLSVGSPFRAL